MRIQITSTKSCRYFDSVRNAMATLHIGKSVL